MVVLRELAQLIQTLKTSRIDVSDEGSRSTDGEETLLQKFYNGLVAGKYATDRDAARDLYGSSPSSQKYRTLKSRALEHLQIMTLSLNMNGWPGSLTARVQGETYRKMACAKILAILGARNAAYYLFGKVLHPSLEFELTEITLEIARRMRTRAYVTGDMKDFDHWSEVITRHIEILTAEEEAERRVQRLILPIAKSMANYPELQHEATALAAELDILRKRHDRYILHRHYYRIECLKYESVKDHAETIRVCGEAIRYLQSKPRLVSGYYINEFALISLVCWKDLRNYEKGKELAELALASTVEGGYNWYLVLELYFVLTMVTGEYVHALSILERAINHPRFASLPEFKRELWRINQAHIVYIMGGKDTGISPQKAARFRKGINMASLRRAPNYVRDKRGMNVALQILEVLFLIDENKLDKASDRLDALKTYAVRYLNTDVTRRSYLFIRMLRTLERKSFDPDAARSAAEKDYLELTGIATRDSNNMENAEIITYEVLWEQVLSRLAEARVNARSQRRHAAA